MQLAILFWCYKRADICRDRLELLRRFNPHTKIYLLFGGEECDGPEFEVELGALVDDFYTFRDPPPRSAEEILRDFRGGSYWKYYYGDLLIAAWFRDRGQALEWDSFVIIQWDMLVFGAVDELFAGLGPGRAAFSGLRPVSEVAHNWVWVQRPAARAQYEAFLEHVRQAHGFADDPLCCVAIVIALPRAFMQRFVEIERPELGFLEYRLPVYAQIFGIPFWHDHPFEPWWGATQGYRLASTLRALPREVWAPVVALNLLKKNGARIFHPWWRATPGGFLGWIWVVLDALPRIAIASVVNAARRLRRTKTLRPQYRHR